MLLCFHHLAWVLVLFHTNFDYLCLLMVGSAPGQILARQKIVGGQTEEEFLENLNLFLAGSQTS